MAYSDPELDNLRDFGESCARLMRLTEILQREIAELSAQITRDKLDAAQNTATETLGELGTFLATSEAVRPKD